jgi:hypothetical protein
MNNEAHFEHPVIQGTPNVTRIGCSGWQGCGDEGDLWLGIVTVFSSKNL